MVAVSWPLTKFDRWATIWIQNQDVVLSTYCNVLYVLYTGKFAS
jgi:hypothetical protein